MSEELKPCPACGGISFCRRWPEPCEKPTPQPTPSHAATPAVYDPEHYHEQSKMADEYRARADLRERIEGWAGYAREQKTALWETERYRAIQYGGIELVLRDCLAALTTKE